MSELRSVQDGSSLSLVPSLALENSAGLQEALDAAERTIAQLEIGLCRRVIIGQAQGLLMAHLGLDGDQALAYLRRASNELNRKLFDVAEEVVRTRELPQR